MQTIVRPVATLPGAWDVEFSGGWVGQGIEPGPYSSCGAAMAVIAEYTHGSCTLIG